MVMCPPSPLQYSTRFLFIVGLYRRFLPRILITIKIPLGHHRAREEDARVIGQGLASLGCSTDSKLWPKVDSD